ncbi:MAG: taurine dioxygenase [Alphaproteobacteria bacterium]|nr:taurine dioxygenase [Alphaproteobacteria bacterium]
MLVTENASGHTRAWPFETRPLSDVMGVEITDIGMETAVRPEFFPFVYEAFLDHQVLLFRDTDLSPETQVAFARCFGEVEIHVLDQYYGSGLPEIYLLSNLGADGNPTGEHPDPGTMHWHTDLSWRPRTGLATMMYAVEAPREGGETHLCDMYGAYQSLSEGWIVRLAGVKAIHNLDFSRTRRQGWEPLTDEQRAKAPPSTHPILRTHPETGRQTVFLGDHAECIEGIEYDEGRSLVEEINELIAPEELVYQHRWEQGDLIVWDNRCTMHRATAYDTANDRRVMRRCTVNGDAPF